MDGILKLSINGSPDYIEVAKMSVATLAAKLGFDMDQIEEIEMAIEEACKLLTCHGHENWCAEYSIECFFVENVLTIKLVDSGKGNIDKAGVKCCVDCPNEGDLGFHVIKTLMDQVEISKGSCRGINMSKGL